LVIALISPTTSFTDLVAVSAIVVVPAESVVSAM
jgi:hypothetical protein